MAAHLRRQNNTRTRSPRSRASYDVPAQPEKRPSINNRPRTSRPRSQQDSAPSPQRPSQKCPPPGSSQLRPTDPRATRLGRSARPAVFSAMLFPLADSRRLRSGDANDLPRIAPSHGLAFRPVDITSLRTPNSGGRFQLDREDVRGGSHAPRAFQVVNVRAVSVHGFPNRMAVRAQRISVSAFGNQVTRRAVNLPATIVFPSRTAFWTRATARSRAAVTSDTRRISSAGARLKIRPSHVVIDGPRCRRSPHVEQNESPCRSPPTARVGFVMRIPGIGIPATAADRR